MALESLPASRYTLPANQLMCLHADQVAVAMETNRQMVKEALVRKLEVEGQWRRVQQVADPQPVEEEMKVDEEQRPIQDVAPSDD